VILRFYDDPLEACAIPRSIFLAGPTSARARRTPWRAEAIAWLEARDFAGTVILPEFRDGLFEELAPRVFASPASAVPGMRAVSHNILCWETTAIEHTTVLLVWMPFRLGSPDDPASLPGFTTRAEVSRELVRDPKRIVLGMPPHALSASHIRFHAHRAGVPIASTLEATLAAAYARVCP
jgi:hypothetical protein